VFAGPKVIDTTGAGGGGTVKPIVAVAVFEGSPWLVAVTTTFCALAMVEGAMYRPVADIVPTVGLAVHDTFVLLDPVTVAVNC
jgi:hypothetical protein